MKHSWVLPSLWHMTGDHYYSHSYCPTYGARNKGNGNAGPDPIPATSEDPANTEPGRLPWHDIDGSTASLEWLMPVGQKHWDLGHQIWETGQSLGRDTATLIESWYLIVPTSPDLNVRPDVSQVSDQEIYRTVGVEQPDGPVAVVSQRLGLTRSMQIRTKTKAERESVEALLRSGETVRMVNILGQEMWAKLDGSVGRALQRWKPLDSEVTNLRDGHLIDVTWREVAAPR